MILDKVKPFFTDDELKELDAAQAIIDRFAGLSGSLPEDEIKKRIDIFNNANKKQSDIYAAARQHYIDHFNGDAAAVLADALEVIKALEKADFIRHQKAWQPAWDEQKKQCLEKIERGNPEQVKAAKKLLAKVRAQEKNNFNTAAVFVRGLIWVQVDALARFQDKDAEQKALKAAEDKAGEWYKRPAAPVPYEIEEDENRRILGVIYPPSNNVFHAMSNAMAATIDPARMDSSYRPEYRPGTVMAKDGEAMFLHRVTPSGEEITVSIANPDKVAKNPHVEKLFVRAISRLHEMYKGEGPFPQAVYFPLESLIGEYKTLETARQGFLAAAKTLTTSGGLGFECKNKRSTGGGTLFTFYEITEFNTCYLYLSPKCDYKPLLERTTILPEYYFSLPTKSASLLHYVFQSARQNAGKIRAGQPFKIVLRTAARDLALPGEHVTAHRTRDIKNAIRTAVSEINEAARKNGNELEIRLFADEKTDATSYLNSGYMKVYIRGKYKDYFSYINERQAEALPEKNKKKSKKG